MSSATRWWNSLMASTTLADAGGETIDPETHLPRRVLASIRRMRLDLTGDVDHWAVRAVPLERSRRGHAPRWSTSGACPREGLDRLAGLGRLDAAGPESILSWKRYENEVPGRRIHNVWSRQMSTSDKRYVVQTAANVIERCLLMATDPGDLVFDPTCGGGTTAVAAETWGRRWITCDTSPIAVAIARQRLTTAAFDYWKLADSCRRRGGRSRALAGLPVPLESLRRAGARTRRRGFVYERVPAVSAGILGYDENAPPTLLVNQPRNEPAASCASRHRSLSRASRRGHTSRSTTPATGAPWRGRRRNSSRTRRVRRHRDRGAQALADPRGARQRDEPETSTSARSNHGPVAATSSATWSPTRWGSAASSAEQAS